MPSTLVALDAVTKRFGEGAPALDAISGVIRDGEITGLVGPDAAGKTTLIRLMTGLMLPESGTVKVFDFDTRHDAASIQRAIGYMPQRFGLYEDLTVQENLDLYADLKALPLAERPAVFDELLAFTDLKRFATRLAGKLSGGMKQKLGLACALLKKPRLLLLDEPGVGVDPISRRELWRMVKDLAREGIGVLWSTAYLDEAEACDRVLLLNAGKLLFDGAPRDLTARVEGRVFRMSGLEGRRRPILAAALAQDGIIDGVIQGEAIRLVTSARSSGVPQPPALAGAHVDTRSPSSRVEETASDRAVSTSGPPSAPNSILPRSRGTPRSGS